VRAAGKSAFAPLRFHVVLSLAVVARAPPPPPPSALSLLFFPFHAQQPSNARPILSS
jgi:hypothetical protein